MKDTKILGNIDIKSLITIVALVLWMAYTGYAFYIGEFSTVFDFFKEVFMMIIAFYLGTKSAKTTVASSESETITYDAVYDEDNHEV